MIKVIGTKWRTIIPIPTADESCEQAAAALDYWGLTLLRLSRICSAGFSTVSSHLDTSVTSRPYTAGTLCPGPVRTHKHTQSEPRQHSLPIKGIKTFSGTVFWCHVSTFHCHWTCGKYSHHTEMSLKKQSITWNAWHTCFILNTVTYLPFNYVADSFTSNKKQTSFKVIKTVLKRMRRTSGWFLHKLVNLQ